MPIKHGVIFVHFHTADHMGKKAYLGIKKENYIVLSKNISVMKIYKRKFKNNCFTYHLVAAIGYLAFVTTQFFILF